MFRSDEIPREDWPAFFRIFAAEHQGRVCSLGVVGDDPEQHVSMRSLRLAALERDAREGDGIRVLVSDLFGAKLAHVITAPRRVYLHQPVETSGETLEIDGAGGRTVMRFDAPS